MDEVLARTQLDLFWLPSTVTCLDRPDVLALLDGSQAALHNQVLRTSCRPEALPGLIEEIERWHTGASQWLVVPPFQGEFLQQHLPRFGYAPSFQADAYVLDSSARFAEGEVEVVEVHDQTTLEHNLQACSLAFGRPRQALDLRRQLGLCTGTSRRTARFVAYLDGQPVGSGNINRFDALGFGFLWAAGVVPEARGRGIYRALLGARCRWAMANSLDRIGLYANRDTSGPVVAGLGFERHGPMSYWTRSSASRMAAAD